MQLSRYFYHIFLAYVWLSVDVPHLGRSAVVASDKKQDSQQYRRALNQCRQKCSGDIKARISMINNTEGQKPCYQNCLLKIGSLHSTRNQRVKSEAKRMKRDIWANFTQPGDKQGEKCEKFLYTKDALTKQDIHIDFLRCRRGSKTYRTKISWTPQLEITSNWTGYKVVYRVKYIGNHTSSPYFCRDVVGKNKTSTTVSMPNEGIKYLSHIRVSVISLPHTPGKSRAIEDFRFLENCTQVSETPPETLQNPVVTPPSVSETPPETLQSPVVTPPSVSETPPETRQSPVVTPPSVSETPPESVKNPVVTPPSDNLSKEAAIATGAVACFCFLLLVAVVCRWRFKKQNREASFAPLDPDFKFDAFIIYSTVDEKWVTKKLLQTLETKHKIKCCIHYRDFVPGVPFTKNMADSVYNSKKTVAVVSKSFLTSNFCSHELSIALHRLAERRDDSVVVIKLDDVKNSQLPKELRFRSYIDFTKLTDKRTWEYKLVTLFKA